MLSPETFEMVQKGGAYFLLVVAVIWLVTDRNRLLKSLSDKDEIIRLERLAIAAKDEKLAALSERTITAIAEFRGLLGSVVEMFNNSRKR